MEKGTYKGRLYHGPIELDFIIQIVVGMAYLHQLNIIHRKLEVDNICVMYVSEDDDTPICVLIRDFNVASIV